MENAIESGDSGCHYDMPMELLFEILIYLPVKSLVRFSCVCKSWLHMIRNDPRFAIRHYLFRTAKPCRLMDNVDYVVDYFGKGRRGGRSITSEDVFKLSMYSLTENKTFRFEKKIEFGPGLEVSVSNFCHGIMCVFLSSSALGPNILLCNPTIREVVFIPISVNIAIHGQPIFGFGFDPSNNDYKIIAIHRCGVSSKDAHWLVDVYSVRNSSWHVLPVITPLEQFSSLGRKPALNANGRILNWLGYHENNGNNMLVSFNIVDEVFIATTLPECQHLDHWRHYSLLSSSRCRACYCCSPSPSSSPIEENEFNGVDVWVLHDTRDEGDNLWSKQLSFEFPNVEMVVSSLDIWMNDEELFVCVSEKYGYLEVVFHYDLCTRELKRTGRLGNLNNPDGYSESLVSIKGLMLSPPQGVARGDNGDGNDDENTERKDDDGSVYFIREIGKRKKDVHWSYSFKLV